MAKQYKEPSSCYHFAESYLTKEQIERVLNHYRDYISAALYILHDKDKHEVEDDGGVRRQELTEEYNKLVRDINKIDIGIQNAYELKKTIKFDTKEAEQIWVRGNITLRKREKTRLQKKAMRVNDERRELDKQYEQLGTLKKPHYHILIKCYGAHTQSAVRKWFYRFRVTEDVINVETDEIETKLVNTLDKICDSVAAARDYLTHKNEPESSGKYVYDVKAVHTFGAGWQAFNKSGRSVDDVLDILDRLAQGESLRSLVRDYGRDVVINYQKYISYSVRMYAQESNATDTLARENDIIRSAKKYSDTNWYYVLDKINQASYISELSQQIIKEVNHNK